MNFIKIPFASSGDKTNPPATDPAGGVNWTQGYPSAYSKDPATDPSAKRIEREEFNGVLNALSTALNEIQTNGVAPYITAADNDGSAYAYGLGSFVIYNNTLYRSLVTSNVSIPGTDATKWEDAFGVLKAAARLGVATNAQMQAGTATNLLPTVAAVMSLFNKRSFGQNDFIRIPDVPGGLIVQWGKSGAADAAGLIKINLPTTFPNAFQNAQAIYFSANRRSINAQIASLTATELQLWASYANTDTAASTASLWWIAIGN